MRFAQALLDAVSLEAGVILWSMDFDVISFFYQKLYSAFCRQTQHTLAGRVLFGTLVASRFPTV